MKCPHCRAEFHLNSLTSVNFHLDTDNNAHIFYIGPDADGHWWIIKTTCPSCKKYVLRLLCSSEMVEHTRQPFDRHVPGGTMNETLIRPKTSSRPPVPVDVPSEFTADYLQACLVLAESPAASAALSRRSLQHILREKAGVKENNLYREIGAVVNNGTLPADIADNLDYVRKIGNVAAHPTMNEVAGEIVPVEYGEAEWCLEVIESLFDFYFVRPANSQRRREAFDSKLSTGSP